jgi:hypothetical protein
MTSFGWPLPWHLCLLWNKRLLQIMTKKRRSVRFFFRSDCTSNVLLHLRAPQSHIGPSLCKGENPKEINFTRDAKNKQIFNKFSCFFADFLCELSVLIIIILTAQIMDLQKRGQLSLFILKKIESMCNSETETVTFLRPRNYVFPSGFGYHDNCLQHVEQIRLGFCF